MVAGARPNFIKIAPLLRAFKKYSHVRVTLVHTGQHYDYRMAGVFFRQLEIPKPDIYLEVGSGSHAAQTARVMEAFEARLLIRRPDLVVVVGDVNSTLACALAASKLQIPVAHVEAGLRSFDRGMPEETNRIITDHLSDYLFVSEFSGVTNLKREGIDQKKIFFVGNVMIDSLFSCRKAVSRSRILELLGLTDRYGVVTLHRPSNVDGKQSLIRIHRMLKNVCRRVPVVFPAHPRTLARIKEYGLTARFREISNLFLIQPLGYVDFIKLTAGASFVLTDSGGIQEETTMLGVPCLTMRENTERPCTIELGTNRLVGSRPTNIYFHVTHALKGRWKKGSRLPFWDGMASSRIASLIVQKFRRSRVKSVA